MSRRSAFRAALHLRSNRFRSTELEGNPTAGKWRSAHDPCVSQEDSSEHEQGDEEPPVKIFPELERIASGENRAEGNIRRQVGKTVPLLAELALAFGIDRKSSEQRQHEQCAEQDYRCQVSVGSEMVGGPDRNSPQERMAGNAQNSAYCVLL